MQCDQCGERKATRFAIFGRSMGLLIASTWETRPGNLCSSCLDRRFWSTTLVTAVMGWWGLHALPHTLRFLPANVLEYRRARAAPPLPAQPTDEEVEEHAILALRVSEAHSAGGMLFYGVGALCLGMLFFVVLAALRSDGGEVAVVGGIGALVSLIGIGLIVAGASRRTAALHLPADTLAARVARRDAPRDGGPRTRTPRRVDAERRAGGGPRRRR